MTLLHLAKKNRKKHDCRVNWGGSSKGMEADLAVEMLNTVKDDNFAVTTLIGDDTTTMANVRQNVSHTVAYNILLLISNIYYFTRNGIIVDIKIHLEVEFSRLF